MSPLIVAGIAIGVGVILGILRLMVDTKYRWRLPPLMVVAMGMMAALPVYIAAGLALGDFDWTFPVTFIVVWVVASILSGPTKLPYPEPTFFQRALEKETHGEYKP